MPQSHAAAHLRHEEEGETDKTKQAQIEQTYEKHYEATIDSRIVMFSLLW